MRIGAMVAKEKAPWTPEGSPGVSSRLVALREFHVETFYTTADVFKFANGPIFVLVCLSGGLTDVFTWHKQIYRIWAVALH